MDAIDALNDAPGLSNLLRNTSRVATSYLLEIISSRHLSVGETWIPVQLAPDSFRLGLDALHRIHEDDCAVDNAAGTFNFHAKVRVTRCVD